MKPTFRYMKAGRIQTPNLTYEDAVSTGAVESGIRTLTDALNARGLATIASCQGHELPSRWFKAARLALSPYVLFRAPVEVARALSAALDHGHGPKNELYYCWRLSGHFYPPDFQHLVWHLKLGDVRVHEQWDRDAGKADVSALARIVSDLPDHTL